MAASRLVKCTVHTYCYFLPWGLGPSGEERERRLEAMQKGRPGTTEGGGCLLALVGSQANRGWRSRLRALMPSTRYVVIALSRATYAHGSCSRPALQNTCYCTQHGCRVGTAQTAEAGQGEGGKIVHGGEWRRRRQGQDGQAARWRASDSLPPWRLCTAVTLLLPDVEERLKLPRE